MFSEKELNSIDCKYFNIIQAGCYAVTIQSKNTKHYWHIIHESYPTYESCHIEHKHKYSDEYHIHRNQPTLSKAIKEIKKHDKYQLTFRNKKSRSACTPQD